MRWSMGSVADSVVANLANKKSIPNKFCKIYTNNNLCLIQFIAGYVIFFPMIISAQKSIYLHKQTRNSYDLI